METFDPYHKWFGIPPKDQPPHHYRLLAIELFESDADVIDMAADRQMASLKQVSTGPHVQHAQKLLNEVAAARLCLLKRDSKAAYDAALKKKLAEGAKVPASETEGTAAAPPPPAANGPEKKAARPNRPTANPLIVSAPADLPEGNRLLDNFPDLSVSASKPASVPSPAASASQQRKKRLLLIGGGVAGVLVLLAALAISLRTTGETPVAIGKKPDPAAPRVAKKESTRRKQKEGTPADEVATGAKVKLSDAPSPAIEPFDAAQAKRYQEMWARFLDVPVESTNTIGMKFVLIPPGEFTMGSTPSEIEEALKPIDPNNKEWRELVQSEGPRHKVILTRPIYLGVNVVTQAEYGKVMGKNPSHFSPTGPAKDQVAGMDTARHPVEMVSWNDAAEFCAKLSQQEQFKPSYFRTGEMVVPLDGTGYRLPTEAEWEFACRAGTTTKYWSGDTDDDLKRAGWFNANSSARTYAVGGLQSNPFGLFDVHGNVWEWVQDWWEPTYYQQFQERPALNPGGPVAAQLRVLRGLSWTRSALSCRSSAREVRPPTFRDGLSSFRVSRVIAFPSSTGKDPSAFDKRLAELSQQAAGLKLPADALAHAVKALETMDDAIAADSFDAAERLANLAETVGAKTNDEVLGRSIGMAKQDLADRRKAFDIANKARHTLQASPQDPAASATLGKDLCFNHANWTEGLPLLAAGSESELQSIATLDLAKPAAVDSQAAVADAWRNLAGKYTGDANTQILLRALFWYRQAASGPAGAASVNAAGQVKQLTPLEWANGFRPKRFFRINDHIDRPVRLSAALSPYYLTGAPMVMETGLLCIERGTTIIADEESTLRIKGMFYTYGGEQFVNFRPAKKSWGGLELQNPVDIVHPLSRLDVRGAKTGLGCTSELRNVIVEDSVFVQNDVGIHLHVRSQGVVRNCVFSFNREAGIRFYYSRVVEFDHCSIVGNRGNGVALVYLGIAHISNSIISNNAESGIGSFLYETHVKMTSSNIIDNGKQAMSINTPGEMDCSGNYWGVKTAAEISALIIDGDDGKGPSKVKFDNFATTPFKDAGSSLAVPEPKPDN